MEFVELIDYPITPGRVSHWMARSAAPLTEWPQDSRAVSYVHEAHLRSYTQSRSDTRESWIGTALEFEGDLDYEALQRTLSFWADRHEVLRSQVEIIDTENPQTSDLIRRTLPPCAVKFDHVQLGELDSATAVYRALSEQFDTIACPTRWPGYVFSTIERDDNTFTVLFVADHSLLDGYSIYLLGNEIVQLYRQILIEAPDFIPPPLLGHDSYVDFSAQERAFAQEVDEHHHAVQAWTPVLQGKHPATFPLPILDGRSLRGRVAQRAYMSWLLDTEESESFAAVCKSHGANFHAGLIAALALSTKMTSPQDYFAAVMPFHTRFDSRWSESLGWFVGIAPMVIDLQNAFSFVETLVPAQIQQREGRRIAAVPFARVCEIVPPTVTNSFLVSFFNGFAIPGVDQWQEWRLKGLRSKNYSDQEVALFFNWSPSGLVLCGRYPNTENGTLSVHRFLAAFRRIVVHVAETGDFLIPEAKRPTVPHDLWKFV